MRKFTEINVFYIPKLKQIFIYFVIEYLSPRSNKIWVCEWDMPRVLEFFDNTMNSQISAPRAHRKCHQCLEHSTPSFVKHCSKRFFEFFFLTNLSSFSNFLSLFQWISDEKKNICNSWLIVVVRHQRNFIRKDFCAPFFGDKYSL